jgi:hypothetical protein
LYDIEQAVRNVTPATSQITHFDEAEARCQDVLSPLMKQDCPFLLRSVVPADHAPVVYRPRLLPSSRQDSYL